MQGNIIRQLIGDVSEKIAPLDVSNLTIKVGNGKLTVYWKDPNDTVVDGQTVCTWKGTKLVQKAGSYPENVTDGTLVLDNQERNKYATNGFEINGLTNGTTYYFALFPYSTENAVNVNVENRISGIPKNFRTMTAVIDLNNSNPATCITYEDDAVGMSARSSAWDDFFGIYPCIFKNGYEVGKLKENNFGQFEDGTTADITSGDAGDVMIAFPRMGLNITRNGMQIRVSMTDNPNNTDFKYYAHTRGSTEKNKFYLGAFLGYVLSNKLKSLSGHTPTNNVSMTNFRNYAQANGSGYDLIAFYQYLFIQAMYILKYKNLDSQSAIGMGYVTNNSSLAPTGVTKTIGMNYGSTGNTQMKLFGLEDLWGNAISFIDGAIIKNKQLYTTTTNFNDDASGYTYRTYVGVHGGYMLLPKGTSETGFINDGEGASASTYFCDQCLTGTGSVCCTTYSWGKAGNAGGIFAISLSNANLSGASSLSARLMYL